VAPVVLALLPLVGVVGWLFGFQLASQFDLLAQDVPQSLSQLVNDVAATPWGAWFLERMQDMNLTSVTDQLAGHIAALSGSVFRSAAYLAVL
jgi:predicted PurR-regulated permease PerM